MDKCNFSWTEVWDVPISVRKWWIGHKSEENKSLSPQKGAEQAKPKSPPPWQGAPKRT